MRTTRDSVTVGAPVPPSASPQARIDSVPGVPDSLATRKPVRDSIKAPITRAELPIEIGIGRPLRWTRDSLFATGALTVLDLIERVPGLVGFRSGWLASAQTASYLGDFNRVRVFRDGVELDPVDQRTGRVLDLADVMLWQSDEVAIERTAGEVRVYMRSWAVRNVTPYTRVDVATGDEDTNLYRGFYGKRYQNGGALQIAAQQFGTGARNRRIGGGGDAVGAFARVGWSRGQLSVDALLTRVDRRRSVTLARRTQDSVLTAFQGRRDEAYVRVGYGDPERGPWVQAVANALDYLVENTSRRRIDSVFAGRRFVRADTLQTPDSSAYRSQYVLMAGFTRGGLRVSAGNRFRTYATYAPIVRTALPALGDTTAFRTGQVSRTGQTVQSPLLRASFERPWFAVGGYAERTGVDSTLRYEASARVLPLSWLGAVLSASRVQRERTVAPIVEPTLPTPGAPTVPVPADTVAPGTTRSDSRTIWRAELAARLGRLWVTGGRIVREGGELDPPLVYARRAADALGVGGYEEPLPLASAIEPRASGTLLTARGRFYKDVYLDVHATAWDAGGIYRPQYQTRAEIGVETNWLRRFPSGNFGFVFAIHNEYRSRTLFLQPQFVDGETEGELTPPIFAPPANSLGALLEIRIQQATVSFQIRNALNREYQLVPGVTMPGPISFYGVRWNFWN